MLKNEENKELISLVAIEIYTTLALKLLFLYNLAKLLFLYNFSFRICIFHYFWMKFMIFRLHKGQLNLGLRTRDFNQIWKWIEGFHHSRGGISSNLEDELS